MHLTPFATSRRDPWCRAKSGCGPIVHWGGGGAISSPPLISETTGPILKIQAAFESPGKTVSKKTNFVDLRVTSDVTGQVKVKMFDFSGLVTSASKIAMLSLNKANESEWIVSLTFVSITYCAL